MSSSPPHGRGLLAGAGGGLHTVHPADERSSLIGAEVVDDGGVPQYVSLQANSPRRRRRGPWAIRGTPVTAFLDASGLNSASRLLPIIAWLPAYTRAKLTGRVATVRR